MGGVYSSKGGFQPSSAAAAASAADIGSKRPSHGFWAAPTHLPTAAAVAAAALSLSVPPREVCARHVRLAWRQYATRVVTQVERQPQRRVQRRRRERLAARRARDGRGSAVGRPGRRRAVGHSVALPLQRRYQLRPKAASCGASALRIEA
eukprot:scaffold113813_cov63-Phaeocystis_antarctica.AAC.2